jgi:hypothetical protein
MVGPNFVGKAGQLAVMAEFLLRGYNVAMPEVDVGDDIFVVNDGVERLWRIQVKTAIGLGRGYGCSGQYLVPLAQLRDIDPSPLYYIFVLRWEGHWEFVSLSQKKLEREQSRFGVGSVAGDNLLLYLAFRRGELLCSGRSWQRNRNNWDLRPILIP